jgi:hypothetical protein
MLDKIQQYVRQDKLTEALEAVCLFATEKGNKLFFNKALVIEMQYNSLQKSVRRGLTEEHQRKQERAAIALQILTLADEIDVKS